MDAKGAGMDDTERAALNKRLATWAGWRVEQPLARGMTWRLYAPDGTQANTVSDYGEALAESEAEAWQHAPDYVGSLDAGMALVPEQYAVEIWYARDAFAPDYNYRARIVPVPFRYHIASGTSDYIGLGDTRAEALARALDALRASQEVGR